MVTDQERRPLSEDAPLSSGFKMRYSSLRGEKGETGETGQTGERGPQGIRGLLSRKQARAVVYLFILGALIGVACLAGLLHYAGEVSGQQRTVSREQRELVTEQRELAAATRANNADRCTTLEEVVAIPVPHPVAANPSREWAAAFERIERARGRQLGCKPLTRGSAP